MRRCVLLVILLVAAVAAAPAAAKVRKGPAGVKFYSPPSPLPSGKHGAPIWTRGLTGRDRLAGAASNTLLLYRSTSVAGKPIAVSAALALPKGKPPKGGWPLITWAHGTSGIADQCAPTRGVVDQSYDHALMQRWLKAGYAIVRTDYEGLGTPGTHPYLIGVSEGRSVLDAALAARALDARISRNVVISGHSQGGHAALWAASLAAKWTPALKIRGTVAFAPASHIGDLVSLIPSLTSPSGLSGLASMIIRGIDVADPALGIASRLTPQAAALYPQSEALCLTQLSATSSFGALPPAQLFQANADLTPFVAALNANDPKDLAIPTPVQIEQGTADTTVFPSLTSQLEAGYAQRGLKLTTKTYDGLTHTSLVTTVKPQLDATAFIKKLLR